RRVPGPVHDAGHPTATEARRAAAVRRHGHRRHPLIPAGTGAVQSATGALVASPRMEFTVLSHAGLSVSGAGTTLLCDPWLVGSCYWRSWWNYPPPSEELVASLRPDVISLSHIHWDHFHGVS